MLAKLLLAVWSCIGLLWWMISWCLVLAAEKKSSATAPKPREKKSLSIFKPLPPLEYNGLSIVARGLESFISQLDKESELLLGIHDNDWSEITPFINRMQSAYPAARLVIVRRSETDAYANPKIAWQKLLIPHATGELWLWSDADIVASPGFLDRARTEFDESGAEMLTFPYTVRALPHPPALLDALFVNTEFYPGVLLLRRLGPVDFGLGAGMLFSRESFLKKADWNLLGTCLTDDFMLGQLLQPVRLSSTTLETVADAVEWPTALTHYLRWKKTVCWCRPAGFAAQIITMPVLGWLAFALWQPMNPWAWLGLIGMIQADVLFAALICRAIGCKLDFASILATEAWSPARILFWGLCWLPGPVKWREKSWRHIHQPA
jgi:ceramide glucosyltransferase